MYVPHGVEPFAQLLSVPIGSGVIVDFSIGCVAATGPENSTAVFPVTRRL